MGCRVLPGFTGTGGGAAGRANELDPPPRWFWGPAPAWEHTQRKGSAVPGPESV